MSDTETRREGTFYLSQGRYGYGAIDQYRMEEGRSICRRTVVAGITQKLARSLEGELNSAVENGRRDLLDGFDLEELAATLWNCMERLDGEANEARGNPLVPGGTDWEAFATQLEHEAGLLQRLAERIAP